MKNQQMQTSTTPQETIANCEEQVRRRAYELYERRGKTHGSELQDWLEAEAELVPSGHEEVAA